MDISQWITEIVAFLLGGIGGYVIRIVVVRSRADRGGIAASQTGDGVQQIGNVAGGDIAGRDVRKER